MKFSFDDKINNFLKIITKSALEQKTRVFFVGGLVRDNLMGVESLDIDLLVLGNAIEFAKKLPEIIKIKSIHKDFATVKVIYDNLTVDIASTRSEKYPYSGCLPVVDEIGVKLEEDVKRRDFSVNSIYCELLLENNELKYELIDLVNGVEDIKNKTLKVLHTKSYIDDPTRILRGLGFKYRFNFDFSFDDKKLIENYLDNIDKTNLSYDRTYSVFRKILLNNENFKIFSEIIKNGYYKILFNDLTADFEKIKTILNSFSLSKEDEAEFYLLILYNCEIEKIKADKPVEIYNNFSKFNNSNLAYYFYKTEDKNVLLFSKYKDIKLFINGREIIKLGYKQGKIIGDILENLLNEKLTNPDNFKTPNDEINWVLKNYIL